MELVDVEDMIFLRAVLHHPVLDVALVQHDIGRLIHPVRLRLLPDTVM